VEELKVATWNVRKISNKDTELVKELNEKNINIFLAIQKIN
jgi:hypothetical protein